MKQNNEFRYESIFIPYSPEKQESLIPNTWSLNLAPIQLLLCFVEPVVQLLQILSLEHTSHWYLIELETKVALPKITRSFTITEKAPPAN